MKLRVRKSRSDGRGSRRRRPEPSFGRTGSRSAPWPPLRCWVVACPRSPARACAADFAGDGPAGALASAQPVLRYDIPAGPLEGCLAAFEAAAGLKLTFPMEAIRGLPSPGRLGCLHGGAGPPQAARGHGRRPTAGTGADAVALELRRSEAVEVTARAVAPASPKYTEPLRDIPQTITVIPRAGHRGAERHHPARRAAQRPRHHHPGRRGRRARGRQPHHPRLLRPHRHLHRRRARLRRLLPRSLQPRAGGGGEGPGLHLQRPRLHRRAR